MAHQLHQFLLTKKEVLRRTGFSNSALYLKIKNDEFCSPIKIGARGIRFLESEVDAWISERITARDASDGKRNEKAAK